jgi:uncharacterized protein YqgV (UPF0045/DUF77 family)
MNNSNNIINLGIQLIPKNNNNNFELIDKAIEVIKKYNYKTVVTPFETVIECTFEQGLKVLSDLNVLCETEPGLTWLMNVRVHAKTGSDIFMDDKTAKHNQ